MNKITLNEWERTPDEYKLIKPDGQRYVLKYIVGAGTCLVPVEIEEDLVPESCVCPYCGERRMDWIAAPDEDGFCFCYTCNRYYVFLLHLQPLL